MTDDRYTALVPQGLDDADKFLYGRTAGDIIIYLGLPLMTLFVLSMFDVIPVPLFAVLSIASITTTLYLYRNAGTDTTVTEYLRAKCHRLQLPAISPTNADAVAAADTRPLRPDGGELGSLIEDFTSDPRNISLWEDATSASDYTRVHGVYPQFDVIQRDDGAYITAVAISGTNLYLRSRSERNKLVEQFVGTLREIDFPHQLFITTRDFDVESHAQAHADNARHDDITTNPILQELHDEYQHEVLQNRRIQHTRERTVYGIIEYEPGSDRTDASGPDEIDADSPADLERRQETIDRLVARRNKYIAVLSNIAGVTATPVDYQTHLGELAGHWDNPLDADPVEVQASPIIPPGEALDPDSDPAPPTH